MDRAEQSLGEHKDNRGASCRLRSAVYGLILLPALSGVALVSGLLARHEHFPLLSLVSLPLSFGVGLLPHPLFRLQVNGTSAIVLRRFITILAIFLMVMALASVFMLGATAAIEASGIVPSQARLWTLAIAGSVAGLCAGLLIQLVIFRRRVES